MSGSSCVSVFIQKSGKWKKMRRIGFYSVVWVLRLQILKILSANIFGKTENGFDASNEAAGVWKWRLLNTMQHHLPKKTDMCNKLRAVGKLKYRQLRVVLNVLNAASSGFVETSAENGRNDKKREEKANTGKKWRAKVSRENKDEGPGKFRAVDSSFIFQ
nr:protein CHROMATIN REMODELING 8 [Ipomoea batatas]